MNKESSPHAGVKEIARRANVSIATVDRVIHNRTGVSEKTRKKINEIIQELDYQPNILASRLASKKVITLAVLIPRVSEETDFWEAPLRGVDRAETEIRKYGVHVEHFLFDLNDKNSFATQAAKVLEARVQGVLLAPSFPDEAAGFLKECQDQKIPIVLIDSDLPDQDRLCYIGPHLFQSGYVGAKLLTYRLKEQHKVLVVNISTEADSYNFMQIEEGFRSYFKDQEQNCEVIRTDISNTDNLSITRDLTRVLHEHDDVEAIFVTNSRVFAVAAFLQKINRTDISLIGYDFLKENVRYLHEGVIDFLICHKPEEQGFRGLMALHQKLVLGSPVEKLHFMPIDIITKENQTFYQN